MPIFETEMLDQGVTQEGAPMDMAMRYAQGMGDACAVMLALSMICFTIPKMVPPVALALQGSVKTIAGAYQNVIDKAPVI